MGGSAGGDRWIFWLQLPRRWWRRRSAKPKSLSSDPVAEAGILPDPPDSSTLDPLIEVWPRGRSFVRCHSLQFGPRDFNPGYGRGRFHPFQDASENPVPTLYAADRTEGALSETVLHSIPGIVPSDWGVSTSVGVPGPRDAGRGCPESGDPLRPLPQRVHLLQGRLGGGFALGGEALFDVGETLPELAVGAGEGGLGVDVELAGQVRQSEEDVSHLLADRLACALVAGGQGVAQLLDLFLGLDQHGVRVRPVEAHAGRLLGQAVGGEERRQRSRHAGEQRGAARLLLQLAALPGLADRLGVGQHLVAEDVRVARHHFLVDAVHDL